MLVRVQRHWTAWAWASYCLAVPLLLPLLLLLQEYPCQQQQQQ
jgi:hypothetical protein